MKRSLPGINIILAFFALFLVGCSTTEEKEAKKKAAFLRFHLQTNADGTRHSMPAQVYRAKPMMLTVQTDAVLDEGFMMDAEVVDVDEHGGFAIKVTFDEAGTRRLHAVTISNKGLRLAVYARWTEDRWLGAPVIRKNISDGVFIFTPDATREESERIVEGLKNVIKKLKQTYTF